MDEPDENSEVIKKLIERKEHLEEVKDSYLQAQDALPVVQTNIDMTDWQLRAYKNAPPEATDVPKSIKSEQLEAENQYLKFVFKVANVPSQSQLTTSTSVTTSGTIPTLDYVYRVGDIGTPSAKEYASVIIVDYQNLQASQNRPQRVRDLLTKINTGNLITRFDDAYKAYQGFRAGSVTRMATANEIRNLLNGFKGDLWNKARKWPEENMTWNTMSARLAINGGGGTEHVVLSNQDRVNSSLLTRLADVLKDREGGSVTNMDSIWTEVLDHLYTVLGLIIR